MEGNLDRRVFKFFESLCQEIGIQEDLNLFDQLNEAIQSLKNDNKINDKKFQELTKLLSEGEGRDNQKTISLLKELIKLKE